jgi:hypothetical protein
LIGESRALRESRLDGSPAQRGRAGGALRTTASGLQRVLLRHADITAGAFLLIGALIFYYPLVLLGRAIVDYDALVFFYPLRAYLGDALRSGRIPLWNPYLFMGAPFLANPQTAVLYPPSWLFVVGPVYAGYTVQLVVHVFLAAAFMYAFARRALGACVLASVVGGLAYGFSGFTVAQTGHLNQLSAAAWLPAVLLSYDRAVTTRRIAWIGLGALALALELLAGHPQVVYMTLIALALFGLVRAPWPFASAQALASQQPTGLPAASQGRLSPIRWAWAVGAGAGIGLLAASVAAAQLVPTLELTSLSIRGGGVRWEDAVAGSLPGYLVPRALLPPFWLQAGSTEFLGYSGVAPLTLAFLGLACARSRFVVFGVTLCGLGLFLALGENNAWYRWFFDSVPGFDTFRVPARWLFLWQLGVSVLAVLGADWIGRGARVDLRRRDIWPRATLVALVLAIGLAWQQDQGEPFPQRRTPAAWAGIAAATLAAGALATLDRTRAAGVLLVGLTAVELFVAADASPARQAPPAELDSPGVAAAWLREHADSSARILSAARPEYASSYEPDARAALGAFPENVVRSLLVAWKWRDTLAPNEPLQLGIRSADGYDGGVLPLQRFVQLSELLVASPRPDGVLLSRLSTLPSSRALDLVGVRYLVTNDGAPAPNDAVRVALGDLDVYERRSSAAMTTVMFRARQPLPDDQAQVRLGEPTFDPNAELVLAPDPSAQSLVSDRSGQAVAPAAADAEHWRARVTLPEAGYLLQREAWYPGWRARVDGQDAPVVRADLLFRAVFVPAGEHDVELYFDSSTVRLGALISLLGLVAVAALLASRLWIRLVSRMDHGVSSRLR